MSYDQRCSHLAAIFLGDEPQIHTEERIHELAILIQSVIEGYINSELAAMTPTSPEQAP